MSDRSPWLITRSISVALAAVGLVGVLLTSGTFLLHWFDRKAWLESEERLRIERQLEANLPAPDEREADQLVASSPAPTVPAFRATPTALPGTSTALPSVTRQRQQVITGPLDVSLLSTPTRQSALASLSKLEVLRATILLSELPEPGAPAVLVVSLKNHASEPGGPITVGVSADWFDHYAIVGATPSVLSDSVRDDGYRYFEFPAAAPGADVTLELHVTALDETARAPKLKLPMFKRLSLGDVRPTFEVANVSLGRVQSLSVPRLGIRTGVVETAWEPPSFVAGQINSSASLGEGNSVLIGHRGGRAGDVFLPLIGARLGDEVVAAAYGIEQRYVVSEIRTLPGHDIQPIRATETPRLTLMTCTGTWYPLTGDYSHRLWVIAEPPDLARATLEASVERANQAAATADNRSEALKARTAAALARAALTIIDARSEGRR